MLWKATPLTKAQQDVLAAIFAYDHDGQRRFRIERGIKKGAWRRTVTELENMGIVAGNGDLTEVGEKQVHALPRAIWGDI